MRTHYAIQRAFYALSAHHSPDEITVSSIAQHAGIHRKTFYLHYSSVEELYEARIEELVSDFAKSLDALPQPFNYYDLSLNMFRFYSSTEDIERIFINPHYRTFADTIITGTTRHSRSLYNPYRNFSEAEQELINTFVVYSSVNVWRRWVMSGKQIPMEDAARLLGRLLEHGVSSIRAPYEGPPVESPHMNMH